MFIEHPEEQHEEQVVSVIVRLPNPCFPDTMKTADSGFQHLVDEEPLDCYSPDMRAECADEPASVGC
jgi:hypothetical protein